MMQQPLIGDEKTAIREVVENWVLWRDAGDWDRFATVWHDDGWMTATWFQGPAREFIEVSREGFEQASASSTFSAASRARSPATAPLRRRR